MGVVTASCSLLLTPVSGGCRHCQLQCVIDTCVRWVSSLPVARVLRWGGMISTPDAALQSVMRRSLLDTGCPLHCVDELMDSAHERRWPPGLGTLEMRQQNRRHFENYVCRRIPGRTVTTSVVKFPIYYVPSPLCHVGDGWDTRRPSHTQSVTAYLHICTHTHIQATNYSDCNTITIAHTLRSQ